ncbi:MAG: transketolase [Chloroflexi bacterium HGW-Chloroflexi-10]|nr:MAG: transketolase [Chloroflexi bacterium HGW-Chloroflexi-10]
MSNQLEMRAVYTETLLNLGRADERIVLLEADLMRATGTKSFKDEYPQRTFNVGVAEANMVSVAAGLSTTGKIPFANTFACFAARRTYDQFFISANYARLNVKLVGSDPGVTAALNGGTHMAFEDLGIMRTIPKLVVFEPSDPVSLRELVHCAAAHQGCTYMRLHRGPTNTLYDNSETFELGKGKVLRNGKDIALIATGAVMLNEALQAAEMLANQGISATVVDMHTIKPIDRDLVIHLAQECGAIVTCENHQVINGLGSAVAEVLVEEIPAPMSRVGVKEMFGEVGTVDYLKERFGLTAAVICAQAEQLLEKKKAALPA